MPGTATSYEAAEVDAASRGDLAALRAVVAAHGRFTERALLAASGYDHVGVFKWCFENGAPIAEKLYTSLVQDNAIDCFEFLLDQECFTEERLAACIAPIASTDAGEIARLALYKMSASEWDPLIRQLAVAAITQDAFRVLDEIVGSESMTTWDLLTLKESDADAYPMVKPAVYYWAQTTGRLQAAKLAELLVGAVANKRKAHARLLLYLGATWKADALATIIKTAKRPYMKAAVEHAIIAGCPRTADAEIEYADATGGDTIDNLMSKHRP